MSSNGDLPEGRFCVFSVSASLALNRTLRTKKGCIKSFLMGPYASVDYVNNNFGIVSVLWVRGCGPDPLQTVSRAPHNTPAGMSYSTILWQRPQNLSVFAQRVGGRALMKMQVYLILKPSRQSTVMSTARWPHSIRRLMEYSRP